MLEGLIILYLLRVDKAKEEIRCKVENQSEACKVCHRLNAVLYSLNEKDKHPDWFENAYENNKVCHDLALSIADLADDWHHHHE